MTKYKKYNKTNKINKNNNVNTNINKHMKIRNDHEEELEDWDHIDEAFGNVYQNNPFWCLREKVIKDDLKKEIDNQISQLQLLISDFYVHFNQFDKMSNNVS